MNGVTPREVVRTLLVLVAVVILQFTVCLNLRIAGAHPDLVLGVPLVAGLVMGARKGAMVGFVVGIGADLLLPTPFGLTALVGSVTGCLAGLVTDAGFEANPVLLTPMVALVGSAISVVFEAALGAKLFRRGPSGLAPTRAGEEALVIAEQMAAVAHRLEGRILGRDPAAEGFVRVTTAESFARAFLAPRLAAFFRRHPRIELSINTDNRVLSLSRREADVALRHFRPSQASLVTRKIGRVAFAPYASPSYVSQRRSGPDAYLGFEDELALMPDADWPPERRGRAYALGTNSRAVLESAAACGLGIAVLPCYLADGRADLVRVGAASTTLVRDLWLVVNDEQKDLARVRAFVDFIVEQVAGAQDVLMGRVKVGARRRGG